jgi:hypothetical protein
MKGWWESDINVWFRFMYSQKWNWAALLFPKQNIMYCLPISTFMYLRAIYIFPGLVCLYCCSQIGRPILGIYISLTDTWMLELGTRPLSFISGNTSIGWIFGTVWDFHTSCKLGSRVLPLKVHKIENFFDSDFGICVISLLVRSKY